MRTDITELSLEQGTIPPTDPESMTYVRSLPVFVSNVLPYKLYAYAKLFPRLNPDTDADEEYIPRTASIKGREYIGDTQIGSFNGDNGGVGSNPHIDSETGRYADEIRCTITSGNDSEDVTPSDVEYSAVKIEYPDEWYVSNGKLTHRNLAPVPDDVYIQEPYPPMFWYIEDNRLTNGLLAPVPDDVYIQPPYPPMFWYVEDDKLKKSVLPEPIYQGAFCNCTELKTVVIPASVKYIGEYAFYNTRLTAVTIARDCTYFLTSFPPRCTVNFYPSGGE